MKSGVPHICVCICTFKRLEMLRQLLQALHGQQTNGQFSLSAVVADNDRLRSAERTVAEFASQSGLKVVYCVQPEQNIALTRNVALAHAQGDYFAFIDDDEVPIDRWLLTLFQACQRFAADGVLGPVRPRFQEEPPRWVRKGQFFDRPEHETGFVIPWSEGRTGNVLFQAAIVAGISEPFRRQFGSGGEDRDFFRRMIEGGRVFVWCNEAVAHESIPAVRWRRSFMLRRALLRGKMSLNHTTCGLRGVLASAVAVALYSLALPFLLLLGEHQFMKYLVRLCDHMGRLLAYLGINPVREVYVTE